MLRLFHICHKYGTGGCSTPRGSDPTFSRHLLQSRQIAAAQRILSEDLIAGQMIAGMRIENPFLTGQ